MGFMETERNPRTHSEGVRKNYERSNLQISPFLQGVSTGGLSALTFYSFSEGNYFAGTSLVVGSLVAGVIGWRNERKRDQEIHEWRHGVRKDYTRPDSPLESD